MAARAPSDVDVFGSLLGPVHAYFAGVETLSQSFGPMKGIMRGQLEIMGFMSRRAQAYMELPSRVARCRTPQDLMSEQAAFWRTACEQHMDSSRRVMEAWSQAFAMPGTAGSGARTERDYITFPTTKDPEPPEISPTVHRLRRRVA